MAIPEAGLEQFRHLRGVWPSRGWSFDNRFECVASSFSAEDAPEARVLLEPLFPQVFSERTLATAIAPIQEAAKRTGGVRAKQMIFGGINMGRLTPYGLWWPWEAASTISLRVGLEGASSEELLELCECFGIED